MQGQDDHVSFMRQMVLTSYLCQNVFVVLPSVENVNRNTFKCTVNEAHRRLLLLEYLTWYLISPYSRKQSSMVSRKRTVNLITAILVVIPACRLAYSKDYEIQLNGVGGIDRSQSSWWAPKASLITWCDPWDL